MRNILITGGNGFIGSHLVDRLALEPDVNVTVFDLYSRVHGSLPTNVHFVQADLSNIALVRRALEDNNVDLVYHLAWASIVETSLNNVVADLEANLIPAVNLLDACCNCNVERVIFLSSGGTVYGIPNKLPIPESHPTNPISAYGVTKLSVEKYIQMYRHLYGLNSVIVRPSVPFGPRQNPHKRQGVIAVFTYNALTGKPVTLLGDGNHIIRDYFYIDDLIEALIQVQSIQPDDDTIFNLGGSIPYSLNEIIKIIQDVLGIDIHVRREAPRVFDVPHLVLDTSRAANTFGWVPRTSIEDGVTRTAEWIQNTLLDTRG
jgi:UDP-glucose 4-epimerase